jgi:hypothetical protein
MRLVKIIVKHKGSEIERISESKAVHFDVLTGILSNIEFVEFTDESKFAGFLCVTSEELLSRMIDCFINLSFDFSIEDMTNKVLLSEEVSTNYFDSGVSVQDELNQLIDEFYYDNVDVDMVLDKISAQGLESLSTKDKIVLKKF